jgi:hypothetical protein
VVVGINHTYRHQCDAAHDKAVTYGLQHLAFHPLLINLPHNMPSSMDMTHTYADDEQFALNVFEHYGAQSIVKLRYLIPKFDVGFLSGGLQHSADGQQRQQLCGEALVDQRPDMFALQKTSKRGRLAGVRSRLRRDVCVTAPAHMGDRCAADVIEDVYAALDD